MSKENEIKLDSVCYDTISKEIVIVSELTTEPNYVKINGKNWSRFTATNLLLIINDYITENVVKNQNIPTVPFQRPIYNFRCSKCWTRYNDAKAGCPKCNAGP